MHLYFQTNGGKGVNPGYMSTYLCFKEQDTDSYTGKLLVWLDFTARRHNWGETKLKKEVQRRPLEAFRYKS